MAKISKTGQVIFRPSQYFLMVTPDVLHYKNGRFTEGATLAVSAYKRGDEQLPVGNEEVMISVQGDSDPSATTSITGRLIYTVKTDAKYVMVTLGDVDGTKTYDSKKVLVIRDGDKGSRLRMRDWAAGMEFTCGAEGEAFYDVAIYSNKLYLCLVSHTSGSVTPQQSVANKDGKWEVAQDWVFVATRLLLAERIKAEYIDTENLVTKRMLTDGAAHIEIDGSEMRVYNSLGLRNIRFGVNEDGMAVMEYYDNDGRKLYDLGPEGIKSVPVTEESWTEVYMQKLGDTVQEICSKKEYKSKLFSESYKVYQYHSKVVAGVIADTVNDTRFFTSKSLFSNRIPDGYYRVMPTSAGGNNSFMQVLINEEDGRLLASDTLIHMSSYNEPVYARMPIYEETLWKMENGLRTYSGTSVYWNSGRPGATDIII